MQIPGPNGSTLPGYLPGMRNYMVSSRNGAPPTPVLSWKDPISGVQIKGKPPYHFIPYTSYDQEDLVAATPSYATTTAAATASGTAIAAWLRLLPAAATAVMSGLTAQAAAISAQELVDNANARAKEAAQVWLTEGSSAPIPAPSSHSSTKLWIMGGLAVTAGAAYWYHRKS
jgi:hypothetical protein